jgi:pantoate--beta-alanine ligase
MAVIHLRSVAEARPVLRDLQRSGDTVGSIHTLGALHHAHGELIQRSAADNDHTIVTIYPNKIQLFPGSVYEYDLDEDVAFAEKCGATVVISSTDAEMYPREYATFLDQGDRARRLNSSVFDYASRGQVTGAIRWISLCRPTVSYFGMKDIEQSLLVRRAVADLMIDCEIRHVPCVRSRATGIPISSRLRFLPHDRLAEVGAVYHVLQEARLAVASGVNNCDSIAALIQERLAVSLRTFTVIYVAVVDGEDFAPLASPRLPFVLHCAITDGSLTHFDGLYISTEHELHHSPDMVWVD